jgi:hypothetical protein
MKRAYEELRAAATILALLDRRRIETGDAALGSGIERAIIARCLAQLEKVCADGPFPALTTRAIHRQ